MGQVTSDFKHASFELVRGNHDILSEHQYHRHGLRLHSQLTIGNLLLTHEELGRVPSTLYNLSGHVHPGVRLRGKGRQSLVLPCFYFGRRKGLLPAFGSFTGLATVRPREGETIFAIVGEEKIMAIE
jgi:metallophosphoesterase superfamily enzyme